MEKKNKGIKICVYGGLTALALTGTMVLCGRCSNQTIQSQESSVSVDETYVTKKIMVGTKDIMGYVNGKRTIITIPVYEEKLIQVGTKDVMGYVNGELTTITVPVYGEHSDYQDNNEKVLVK